MNFCSYFAFLMIEGYMKQEAYMPLAFFSYFVSQQMASAETEHPPQLARPDFNFHTLPS